MLKVLTIWASTLTALTAGGFWYTHSRSNIPYVGKEKIMIREGNHRTPYFMGPHYYRRTPTGGGLGHGK